MDAELERFKSGINIAEYAQSIGYEVISRESSKTSIVLKSGGDKIIVATDKKDGHGVYFSAHDDRDKGSIIDFAQKRVGGNLGQIRKELRGWMPDSKRPSIKRQPLAQRIAKPQPSQPDHEKMAHRYAQFKPYDGKYLQSRGLPNDWLKAFNVMQDDRGNAVFPHRLADNNLSGWEVKNKDFTGFSADGSRGLFVAKIDSAPTKKVIVTESAIDAISRAIIGHEPGNVYVSTGGSLAPNQINAINDLLQKHTGASLHIGFDNDTAGQKMQDQLVQALPLREMYADKPQARSKDFNEELQCMIKEHQHKQQNQQPQRQGGGRGEM